MRKSVAWVTGLVLCLAIIGVVGVIGYGWLMDRLVRERCYVVVEGASEPLQITSEQARNAAVIVAASYKAELPEQAAVIALATAWQESGLRNLDYGDRDSLGLFQQRPSQGWGTPEQIQDPWYSSAKFYEALVKVDGWESGVVNDVAQAVQRSGHPDAYAKHEANARALAGAMRGTRPETFACVDRQEKPGNAEEFTEVVAAVPGVTSASDGATVTLTSTDQTALWSATNLALASTRAAGITGATVGGRSWELGNEREWRDADQPAPAGTVTIWLREG